jgi:hypothetical protein
MPCLDCFPGAPLWTNCVLNLLCFIVKHFRIRYIISVSPLKIVICYVDIFYIGGFEAPQFDLIIRESHLYLGYLSSAACCLGHMSRLLHGALLRSDAVCPFISESLGHTSRAVFLVASLVKAWP